MSAAEPRHLRNRKMRRHPIVWNYERMWRTLVQAQAQYNRWQEKLSRRFLREYLALKEDASTIHQHAGQ